MIVFKSKKVLQNIQRIIKYNDWWYHTRKPDSRTQLTASLYGIILSKTKDIIRDIKYMTSARA